MKIMLKRFDEWLTIENKVFLIIRNIFLTEKSIQV